MYSIIMPGVLVLMFLDLSWLCIPMGLPSRESRMSVGKAQTASGRTRFSSLCFLSIVTNDFWLKQLSAMILYHDYCSQLSQVWLPIFSQALGIINGSGARQMAQAVTHLFPKHKDLRLYLSNPHRKLGGAACVCNPVMARWEVEKPSP